MKISIVSESPADEAAIRILVDAVLGISTEPIGLAKFRTRGWSHVLGLLPSIVTRLHYDTDADGLVVVLDSDRSPVHLLEHDEIEGGDATCRLCQMRRKVVETLSHLSEIPGRTPLRVAFGLAIPSVEAWYLCGVSANVSEASWINATKAKKQPYNTAQLKREVYGTDRPPLHVETQRAKEAAKRIVASEKLEFLEQTFANGFGTMADSLRQWRD
jgi:hypothetical protein